MTADDHSQRVPVAVLRHGLYITSLDRPWTDTPFLFQGFELTDDTDLAVLRDYCREVFIDRDLSRREALAAMDRALARQPAAPEPDDDDAPAAALAERWRQAHASSQDVFGQQRTPDGGHFRHRLMEIRERRDEARHLVEQALEDVRLGAMVATDEARRTIDSMIDSVARDARAALWLTSLKDANRYTSQHSVHVCVMTLAFGMYLGIERSMLERIALGALLHDIGKIHIPQHILDKPGALTLEEFERVKRHPIDGFEAVSASGGVPPEALQIIRLHHERRSGTGYPDGLAGDRVPRHVLIVGLADTYDAMTSDRPYRAGMEPDRALQAINNEMASEFGSDLVQSFLRCMGVFPEGSLVQLDNGAIGIVLSSHPDTRLRPVVMLVQDPNGQVYHRRPIINLAVAANDPSADSPRRIARAVAPSACNFDTAKVLAAEFELEAT